MGHGNFSSPPADGAIMSPHTFSASTTDTTHDLPADVRELASVIGQLPEGYRQQIEPFLNRVLESTSRRRRILTLVQDALGQLRLDMKYLMFDLEATRRERDEFRDQLNELDNE
jgi:hypothetical protein